MGGSWKSRLVFLTGLFSIIYRNLPNLDYICITEFYGYKQNNMQMSIRVLINVFTISSAKNVNYIFTQNLRNINKILFTRKLRQRNLKLNRIGLGCKNV